MRPANHSGQTPLPPIRSGAGVVDDRAADRPAGDLHAVHEQPQRRAVVGGREVRPDAGGDRGGRPRVLLERRRDVAAGQAGLGVRVERVAEAAGALLEQHRAPRAAERGRVHPGRGRHAGRRAAATARRSPSPSRWTPSNVSAPPKRPAVVRVAPLIVPPLPALEASVTAVPDVSSNAHAPTRPVGVGQAGASATVNVTSTVFGEPDDAGRRHGHRAGVHARAPARPSSASPRRCAARCRSRARRSATARRPRP